MNAFARWELQLGVIFSLLALCFSGVFAAEPNTPDWKELRMDMVKKQIQRRGIKDPAVLEAMRVVKRHELVPAPYRKNAYEDHPLPIGENQTISQPYIVGLMSELLQADPGDKILEIGTGSGYQAAVLAEMGLHVFSIEIIESLAKRAEKDLARIGYPDVSVKWGDGYQGWPEEAPFDGIIITAAPPQLPKPLIEQLKVGGRIVVPVGRGNQELNVYTKKKNGKVSKKRIIPVRFVPMTGRAQEDP
ncbi:MAG: protein-L-isoaspartate(D-aspartate) O-methyltransferase [Verrucomicrobia bacterium]|nr:protein-L-isoaspartate(D-aspartate) O-methyltransferase [Verrucomicrobiota bacterium]